MEYEINSFDISAEGLLNYLYPDLTDQWQVDCEGAFYRNYSPDVLSVDPSKHTVRLSRDGFVRLLPQGMIARENALKGGDFKKKYEQLKKRKEFLSDLFKPVDTLSFRHRLHLEKQAAELSSDKLAIILARYFDYNLTEEENPYIRKIAPLLLHISRLRADFGFIRNLLACLFECDVKMRTGRYSLDEDIACSQPSVDYELIIPNLTTEIYQEMSRAIEPLKDFICEWFIPFYTRCNIRIKYHEQPFVLGDVMILDYNTELDTSVDSN